MAEKILRVNPRAAEEAVIERAASVLRQGGLVAFPTETVYGLGARAADPAAIERLVRAKGRPSEKPFSLLVAGLDVALELCAESHRASLEKLGRRFWPGPLTIVVPGHRPQTTDDRPQTKDQRPETIDQSKIQNLKSKIETFGIGHPASGIGLRVPDHPIALALLEALGEPLAAPSANPSGTAEPRTAQDVMRALGDVVDLVLDGGETEIGRPSTVVDLTGAQPVILREGPVSLEEIEYVLER